MSEISLQPLQPLPVQTAAQPPSSLLSEAELAKAKEFEAMFLSQFVDEMMRTVDTGGAAFGGQDGDMWRSFLSEAIADHLADAGGLGLAQSVENKIAAYKRS